MGGRSAIPEVRPEILYKLHHLIIITFNDNIFTKTLLYLLLTSFQQLLSVNEIKLFQCQAFFLKTSELFVSRSATPRAKVSCSVETLK